MYPDGCYWKPLFCQELPQSHCDITWWSILLQPQGGLYLLTQISSWGQIASAVRTVEEAVEPEDDCYLHYSKRPKNLHALVCALWEKDWAAIVQSMNVTTDSLILQEWIRTLDTLEGYPRFAQEHQRCKGLWEKREKLVNECGMFPEPPPKPRRQQTHKKPVKIIHPRTPMSLGWAETPWTANK